MFDISTICAIASPSGTGAIACLRLSGKEALNILNALIIESNTDIEKFQARKLYKCSLGKAQEIVDEVLVTYYKAPHSYTGEDSVEIFCHGGAYIQQRLLELMLEAGAKPVAPGEFTQRAFLNGRLDLSQSEAVAELISGVTASQHNLAMKQLRGGVKNEIAELRQELLNFVSLVELELDFPEEDVEFANREDLQALIADIISKINKLILGFKYGNAIKNGLGVAIVGRPNT
ncbi:MAG: tRNA uridine-5-carboxymethylaminomethyl(34) synthesis GTPase MnmE, partial [Bacteroidales bacterium]|nr:tRNA uridine-5-carboxymethylaminomethyl(34) synthesis GTPase MnmE [Bacteroidales bacterium]